MKVTKPQQMNEAFARAFNRRSIANLLAFYEPYATHTVDTAEGGEQTSIGLADIERALQQLLQVPGVMTSNNNFCLESGDLALLRADWRITNHDGSLVASGSSAEIARRQSDGFWLYVIDHATGASLPSIA
ncbi:hypothetical protein MHY87_07235 [Microvirga sp. ACRRW]|uniref:YybH family protein n=1 Tax=Microvirga sp. ACRRW TaxID=2918205 RepID=UPI001EF73321|nr:nuclear transport factor 2 family protein [Microvirga sp. ACRRW]MCG7392694.1 hypothetical protein [Microvirga sp. ACRRW]